MPKPTSSKSFTKPRGTAGRHVAGDAAQATEGTGSSTVATPVSSDWLAELKVDAPPPTPGVAIDTKPGDPAAAGRALESKRGQR